MSTRRTRTGYTLVEAMVVATIMVLLTGLAAPSFRRAVEQTKADIAGANLRAIWAAERLYWLKNRTYTTSFDALRGETLGSEPLLDPKIPFLETEIDANNPSPYLYSIPDASMTTFHAQAVRSSYQNSTWSGRFAIDENGELLNPGSNYVRDGNPMTHIVPGFR